MQIRQFAFLALTAPLVMQSCPPPKHPGMSLTPAVLVFSPQVASPNAPAGTAQTVTVRSSGYQVALTISSISSSGDYTQTNNCPSSLPVGSTCAIQVTFAPNELGVINGAITIGSNAGTRTVSLSGTGVPPVGFSSSSVDFGSEAVGSSSAAQTVTLTNNQSVALNISSISVSGDYSQTNNCTASVAAQGTCTISVIFKPSVTGPVPGALTVATDAVPGTQPVGLTGTGTGTANMPLSFSPASLDFGNLEAGATSASKPITVTNTSSSSSATINAVSSSSGYTETDTCAGQSLAPSATCTINVTFQPASNFVPVSYPGAISVASGTYAQVVGLSGSAVPPVSSAPQSVTFPTVQVGFGPPTQTVTLTNNDSAAETVSISNTGPFTVSSNTCPSSMPAGSNCTLGVDWNGGTGPSAGSLQIGASSAGFLNPQVASLSACSTNAVVAPQSLNFGDIAVGATSQAEVISLFNADGANALNISSAAISGANAGDFTISNNTCGSSVASGASCEIDVTLTPSASGTRNAALNLTDDGLCSPQVTALTAGSSSGPFVVTVNDVLTYFNGTYLSAGTITSNPAGINCGTGGSTCSASFAAGTNVTLTATPNTTLNFLGWGEGCSGTGSCALTMTSDQQVSASFSQPQLNVATAGSGTGTVTSTPAGITCGSGGSTCSTAYSIDATVNLTATPDTGFGFLGWSGACSGNGGCTLTMNQSQSVTATFNPFVALSVSTAGTGTGTVTTNPGGITCGSGGTTCSANFVQGASVTLTAAPDQGDGFSSWGGACSGTNPSCTVTMSAAEAATANFIPPDYSVSAAAASETIKRGTQGTDVISITPAYGYFGGTVQLTCSVAGPSPMPPCTLSPSSVTPQGGVSASTLTVDATKLSAQLSPPRLGHSARRFLALWLPLSLLGVVFAGAGKARRRRFALGSFLLLVLILQVACGSSGPPPPENYTVTVTAASGAITHSTQVAITVQ